MWGYFNPSIDTQLSAMVLGGWPVYNMLIKYRTRHITPRPGPSALYRPPTEARCIYSTLFHSIWYYANHYSRQLTRAFSRVMLNITEEKWLRTVWYGNRYMYIPLNAKERCLSATAIKVFKVMKISLAYKRSQYRPTLSTSTSLFTYKIINGLFY